MKIEELFIGAWVQEYSPAADRMYMPMQVVGLFDGVIESTAYLDFEGNEADTWEVEVRDLIGIPVTEELLLKNGFAKDDEFEGVYNYGCFYVLKEENRWWMDTNMAKPFSSQLVLQDLYVHQLQTALRWGGVDLKIKL